MAVMVLELGIKGASRMALGPCQPSHQVHGGLGQGVLQLAGVGRLGMGMGVGPVVLHGDAGDCAPHACRAAAWSVLSLRGFSGSPSSPPCPWLAVCLARLYHLQDGQRALLLTEKKIP